MCIGSPPAIPEPAPPPPPPPPAPVATARNAIVKPTTATTGVDSVRKKQQRGNNSLIIPKTINTGSSGTGLRTGS